MAATPPRDCEYGSDLYWLWAWSETIEEFLEQHDFGQCDWMLLEPDQCVRSAFMRYGTKYRAVIEEIQNAHERLQRRRESYVNSPSPESRELAEDALETLSTRIQQGWRIIWDGEQLAAMDHEPVDVGWIPELPSTPVVQAIVSSNEARDEWMYQQKNAGKTHGEIRAALEREHLEWEQLATEQAIGQAIDRYCDGHNLPRVRRKR